jgi:hypothetical protein
MKTSSFDPRNTERICRFLKRMRLGFSKATNWEDKRSEKGQEKGVGVNGSNNREEDEDLP